jgi:AraC-like DNA-binding protein
MKRGQKRAIRVFDTREEADAASAGHRVGYEDPSYFSRDYKKLFGTPPQRDIAQLRSNLEG